jgi:hypothetical protein
MEKLDISNSTESITNSDVVNDNESVMSEEYTMNNLRKYKLKYVAEFLYYRCYKPKEHPNFSQYNDDIDMIQHEYNDMIGFDMSNILDFIMEKLEENKNSKSILVRTLFTLVRSGTVELSKKMEEWLKEMFYILSQNEYGKLPIFPVMELYYPNLEPEPEPLICSESQPLVYHPPVYIDYNTNSNVVKRFSC